MSEQIAGVILAAGESKRLGQPKQLLDWKGKPFVRQVAETALAARLDPVVVVTGAAAAEVSAVLDGLPVRIVHNAHWAQGQSSSVKAGLAAVPPQAAAAIFMVVDQPQLPVRLLDALQEHYAEQRPPIIATLVDGKRTNPVLFDRSTFADFDSLEGDTGGRALFSKHQVTWYPWLDTSLVFDVDTSEDYERLLRFFS
ncbi:MAG: nucleotidyltransferase family protein [Anaerolineales bacterium]|nr:MAG: nucleotidyltransferase family protein [Anaerolineales bacterium]